MWCGSCRRSSSAEAEVDEGLAILDRWRRLPCRGRMSTRHFLDLDKLPAEELRRILALGTDFKQHRLPDGDPRRWRARRWP
jgi:Ornithine carbamoyltransferase